jgi:hypothetical protein
MTNRNIILNELRDLDSTLENYTPQNLYVVPDGYFEGLPTQILNRIKALEVTDAKDELEFLSPLLSNVSKEAPYSVPVGYFQDLGESIIHSINADQTSEEEIESLSPLLSSLKNKNPYSVPAEYFESLETKTVRKDSFRENKEAKVISITTRRWYRMAIAAAVIGIVAITGLLLLNGDKINIDKNPQAWVKKNVINTVSNEKIDEFVTLVTPNGNQKAEDNEAAAQAEVKELMKDVPQKEIDAFLNDAIALESNDDIDALMNE